MSHSNEDPVGAAADALEVAADSLSIARDAELRKEAAETRAKEAEAKLVTLTKVASEHEKAVDEIVAFLGQEGWIAPENQIKFASDFKADPLMGFGLIKHIVNLSASPYDEGGGIPKFASEAETHTVEARERALWEKVAAEGA
jgi:hypothetical protein